MTFSFSFADLPSLPPGEVILYCALVDLGLFILAGGLFGPLLAVSCEILGKTRKRMVPVRAARQIAAMSLFFGILIPPLAAAALYHLLDFGPDLFASPYSLPLQVSAGAVALAEILLLLYFLAWPKKGFPGVLHTFCGMLCWLSALLSLYLNSAFLFRFTHDPLEPETILLWRNLPDFFLIPFDSFTWPLLAQGAALSLAAAGAMAAGWLLLLRARTDYGRDYYVFSLPYAAGWALIGGLISLPTAFWAYSRVQKIMLPELSHAPSQLLGILCYALPALACLLWLLLFKSPTPLRHKPGVFMALLLLGAGIGAQFLVLNKVLPSP